MVPGDEVLVLLRTGTRLRAAKKNRPMPSVMQTWQCPNLQGAGAPPCCSPGGGKALGLSPAPTCKAQGALSPSRCLLNFLHLML